MDADVRQIYPLFTVHGSRIGEPFANMQFGMRISADDAHNQIVIQGADNRNTPRPICEIRIVPCSLLPTIGLMAILAQSFSEHPEHADAICRLAIPDGIDPGDNIAFGRTLVRHHPAT